MASVSVVEAPALRRTVVAEEPETPVVRFGSIGEEVKDGIIIKQLLELRYCERMTSGP
jgi:hypothetical protein